MNLKLPPLRSKTQTYDGPKVAITWDVKRKAETEKHSHRSLQQWNQVSWQVVPGLYLHKSSKVSEYSADTKVRIHHMVVKPEVHQLEELVTITKVK
jgi:predicted house-cleaning NTP pyrophosphatase (Maf/HAM1 superfamily)